MKLVLVEWLDSHAGDGWQSLDAIKQNAETVLCRSVGWLLSESEGCKVIVPHISGEKNEDTRPCGRGDLSIPDKAIVKMHVLPFFIQERTMETTRVEKDILYWQERREERLDQVEDLLEPLLVLKGGVTSFSNHFDILKVWVKNYIEAQDIKTLPPTVIPEDCCWNFLPTLKGISGLALCLHPYTIRLDAEGSQVDVRYPTCASMNELCRCTRFMEKLVDDKQKEEETSPKTQDKEE